MSSFECYSPTIVCICVYVLSCLDFKLLEADKAPRRHGKFRLAMVFSFDGSPSADCVASSVSSQQQPRGEMVPIPSHLVQLLHG